MDFTEVLNKKLVEIPETNKKSGISRGLHKKVM